MARGDGEKVAFEDEECLATSRVSQVSARDSRNHILVAALLRERTAVANSWIAHRLAMVHPGFVSRPVVACAMNATQIREMENLKKLLKCDTCPHLP